jgi:hypothetical protein
MTASHAKNRNMLAAIHDGFTPSAAIMCSCPSHLRVNMTQTAQKKIVTGNHNQADFRLRIQPAVSA